MAEAGAEADLPAGLKSVLDLLRTLPKAAHINEVDQFSYGDLRRALAEEKGAFPTRQLLMVCGHASSVAAGRLRREYGLRGPCDDTLIRFHCGGKFEALCKEEGLKHLRRVELRGGESYDGLVKVIGEGFVMRSAFEERRVGGHADYERLLRNTEEGRWVQAQEHLEGDFFHIDTVHDGRRQLFQAVSEYTCSPKLAEGRAFGSMPLARGEGLETALRNFASRWHQLLQPRDLSTHLEVVLSGGQPVLVDAVAHMPETGIRNCLQSNFSINFADLDLQVQTGLPVPMEEFEPVPAFWVRLPHGESLTRLEASSSGECSDLIDLDDVCEIDDAGGTPCVLVRHRNRVLLRRKFECLRARW